MVIGEKHLLDRLKAPAPRIEVEKTDVVQVQDLRAVFAGDPLQTSARIAIAVGRFREHFKSDVRQIEKPSHFFGWFRKKAKYAFPSPRAQLERQLSRKAFGPSDAKRFNAKD